MRGEVHTAVEDQQSPAVAAGHADRPVRDAAPPYGADGDPGYFARLVDRADRRDRAAETRDRHADSRDAAANVRADDTESARIDRGLSSVDRFHAGRDRDIAADDRAAFLQALRLDIATQQATTSLEHAATLRAISRENRARARSKREDTPAPREGA